jgi:cytochrome c556
MKFVATLALAAAAFVLAGPASAQSFQKPEDAIRYRQGAFRVLSAHFGALGAMANGRAPYDAQAASHHADVIALVSHLPYTAFGPGTDKGDTRAKPEVWTEQAKFKESADKMQDAVAKLAAAAKTGSVENLKTAFGPAGQTCKACHDNFRKE